MEPREQQKRFGKRWRRGSVSEAPASPDLGAAAELNGAAETAAEEAATGGVEVESTAGAEDSAVSPPPAEPAPAEPAPVEEPPEPQPATPVPAPPPVVTPPPIMIPAPTPFTLPTTGSAGTAAAAVTVDAPPVEAFPGEAAAVRSDAAADRLYELAWESGLLTLLTIARRELGSLFLSPIAYVVGAVIIVPTSIFGYLQQINAGVPVSMTGVFNWVALMMVFFTPLYTMRLLAEEQRSGTLEQLLTSPVRFWELVLGKWLAGLAFFMATIAFTLVYVVLISVYQQLHSPATLLGATFTVPNVDYGSIFTGYVGVVLVGAAWVALGLLVSSLTQNQIIAAIGGIVVLMAFQFLFSALSGILAPPLSDLFDYLSAANRAQTFNQGQIALRDVIYFLTLTAGALFLTTRVIESRKWR